MSKLKLTDTEKEALDAIIQQLEADGVDPFDPQAAIITTATPAIVEGLVMVAVYTAGHLLSVDETTGSIDYSKAADKVRKGFSLSELKELRSTVIE